MSVLLLGISHRSAPVELLERVAVSDSDRPKLLDRMLASRHVSEAMIVSTCNRVEVYAVVEAFHPALADIGETLSEHSGLAVGQLTPHLYVRYSEAAAEHLFAVASGLDSMVVGEQQILGQIRTAYAVSDEHQAAGRTLHELAQQALRVGKRVHSETTIDGAGASVVSVALDHAARAHGGLDGKAAVVLGAGAMGSLAVAHLGRAGVGSLTVVNRTFGKAQHLAQAAAAAGATGAVAVPVEHLHHALAHADVLVTCTGSVGAVLTAHDVELALAGRAPGHQLVICDLGLPRDVDPAAAGLAGVRVIDMEAIRQDPASAAADTEAARLIVGGELSSYLEGQRRAQVTPTVTALRQRAAEVVEAELLRLDAKLPALDAAHRDEVANTVRRVVDKLLHAPTVRVKQLAATPGGDTYAEALRELFELRPGVTDAVAAPMETAVGGLLDEGFPDAHTARTADRTTVRGRPDA